MNLSTIISRLMDCWEKVLFVLMLLLCVVFCILGVMFFMELPEARTPAGQRPTADMLLPWNLLSDKFYHPPIPAHSNANPFAQKLVNHLKPAPKPVVVPQPPKQETPKQETQAVVAQVTTPPQEPPKQEPAKPDIILSVTYKGFYVDIAGDSVAFISVANSQDNSQNRIHCKKGSLIADRISLDGISEESATFKTDTGETVTIPWNATHKFSFRQ